ncbi:hypothetical protein SAMN02927937_01841 [Paenimyroides aquimaris]|uniref:Antibiotic biosynthesis monooxygenase n=1 Tax=Paenimyroides marinum TaxID=1159016 RepID=A0A1H6LCW8_9FLAO|nr:hypothetical protein [Paenimyroides aquimaris]SEH86486.1 hypothetical protein SAMN02927937_01841 [Paenimyroides aquimaris]
MKQSFRIITVISLMFIAFSGFTQNKNQTTMKQDHSTNHPYGEQVSIIDKITVPVRAVSEYSEKSVYIRNILRQQAGFVKYEIFQQEDEGGNLTIITIATWKNQQHLDRAKSIIQEEMKKTGLNIPEFLKQHGISMERGIYYSVDE